MKLVGKKILEDAKKRYSDVRDHIDTWIAEVEEADWENPKAVREKYSTADFPGNGNTIFDFKGTKYRLWTVVNYKAKIVLAKKFGTHAEYSKWKIK